MHERSKSAGDPDSYLSIHEGNEVEIKIKGSRFLGQAIPVVSDEEAAQRLHATRKRVHDASHHCWAFRLGPPHSPRERQDDDGEPSSTAGIPIQRAIESSGFLDTLVIVVRWFGGTKLGTGGLIRAYGQAAREALDSCKSREILLLSRMSLDFDWDDLGAVEAILARQAALIHSVQRNFGEKPSLEITLGRSRTEAMSSMLFDGLSGRIGIHSEEI